MKTIVVTSGSTNQDNNSSIRVQRTVLQFGKPAKVYPDDYKPCDLITDVIDNEFLDTVILCTNAHGRNDLKFRNFLVKVHGDNQFLLVKRVERILSLKNLLGNSQKLRHFVCSMDLKHFGVFIKDELPDKDSEDYYRLQNVLWTLDFLGEKAQENGYPAKYLLWLETE